MQEALGGNCRTALIINCSPAKINESVRLSLYMYLYIYVVIEREL
jgi:hypothetical protein